MVVRSWVIGLVALALVGERLARVQMRDLAGYLPRAGPGRAIFIGLLYQSFACVEYFNVLWLSALASVYTGTL